MCWAQKYNMEHEKYLENIWSILSLVFELEKWFILWNVDINPSNILKYKIKIRPYFGGG